MNPMKFFKCLTLTASVLLLMAGTSDPFGYGVGDQVNDFKLKNVDGAYVALGDFKDAKGAIVIFDCNTCPFSKAYNDRIIALNNKYESKGFPVIAINANDPGKSPGDSFEEMVRVAKDKKYNFPYLVDESQSVAKAFGATNTPHVFVIKREGDGFKVAYIGAIDNNARDSAQADKKYVEAAVDALLGSKAPPTAKTKAIGCGIKWKNS
jgi:peroxiredoxin